jgi:hypothetical protein
MNVQVRKTALGRYRLAYECPKCQTRLTSPLTDAGESDHCPECEEAFEVPGVGERERIVADNEQRIRQSQLVKQRNRATVRSAASTALPYVVWFSLLAGAPLSHWTTDKLDPAVAAHEESLQEYRQAVAEYDQEIARLNETKVYRTRTGYAYHRSYHYADRNYAIGLASALSSFSPCDVCRPPYTNLPKQPNKPLLVKSAVWRTAGWAMWVGMVAVPIAAKLALNGSKDRDDLLSET